jgi:hypothetical protein
MRLLNLASRDSPDVECPQVPLGPVLQPERASLQGRLSFFARFISGRPVTRFEEAFVHRSSRGIGWSSGVTTGLDNYRATVGHGDIP